MSDETLSQDEVDALLSGSDPFDTDVVVNAPASNEARPYDLGNQERIVRGRMPTLEIINERFASNLRNGLYGLLRKTPEISVSAVKVQKFSAFLRNIAVPTNINVVGLKPLKGSGLVICDPQLVFAIVDNLFGGGTIQTRIEGREFSATEQCIITRLLTIVMEQYRAAWAPTYPLVMEYQRSEMHTQFASIATPSEIVVTTSFSIDLGDLKGDMYLCIPYASFESIRDILFSPLQGEQNSSDARWVGMMSRQIEQAQVEMVVNLTEIATDVRGLLSLKVGQVLDCRIPGSLTATVEGVPILDCSYGIRGGRYALRVKEFLSNPEELLGTN